MIRVNHARFATLLLLSSQVACQRISVEEVCAAQRKRGDEEAERKLAGPDALNKKLIDEYKAEDDAREEKCRGTFKLISENTSRSKWNAFAQCMLDAKSLDDQKSCPELLK